MKAIKYLGLTLLLAGCTSPQPKDYYEIVGEVKNVEDSTIINLFRQDGKVGRSIATDTIIGGKGINNVGDIVIKNSHVAVVASGETHSQNGLTSRSRGVTTDGNLTLDGGTLLVKSYDAPLHVKGVQSFLNEAVYNGYQIGE